MWGALSKSIQVRVFVQQKSHHVLCSFNLFSFIALSLLDTHATQPTAIPWHITEDRALVSVLPLAAGEKKLQSIAEATCDVTRQRGVTELRMVDHGITPKMQAWYFDKNLTSFLMFHCFFHASGQCRREPSTPELSVCDSASRESECLQAEGSHPK